MHVTDSLAVGGAERMLVEIANHSSADGHGVSVCLTRRGGDLQKELRPGIVVKVLKRTRRLDWSAIRQFSKEVRAREVDVIYAHGRTTLTFLALLKTLGLVRVPIVFHDHFGKIETDASVPRWVSLWARHSIAQYVGVYSKLGDWAASAGIPRERINVIDNTLDVHRIASAPAADLREEFGISEDKLVGIMVGGIRPEKGVDSLLEAIAQSTHRRSVKILVIGGERDPEYAKRCRELCRSLGLEETVLFVGERTDVVSLMRGADFALLPSRSESGPLVLIEYLACGLPIVASLVGGISHRSAELGLCGFVPPDDVPAFTVELDRLLDQTTSERQARGRAGQQIACTYYDISKAMPRWYEIYRRAIQGSKNKR